MQTSAAIATAAAAQERTPVATLKVDWDANGNYTDSYDDVSARLESLTIQRQLATDLPDEVARSAGYSSAQLTAILSGDPTTEATNAGSYFSPFNTASVLYGKRRRWRTCQLQIGFGSTTLPVFTGKTTGLTVDSASRTATLEALDLAETMRGNINLPLVINDDHSLNNPITGNIAIRPGLNSSWVVDYIARKCGYYASPPPRTNCSFLATLAGSAWAEIGTTFWAENPAGVPVDFTSGKFIAGTSSPASALNLEYLLSSTLSTNDGGEMLLEGWVKTPSAAAWGLAQAQQGGGGGTINQVGMLTDSTNHLVIAYQRTSAGSISTYNTGLTVPTSQWSYIAAHVYFTSTNITIHARVDGSSATTTIASASVTAQPAVDHFSLAVALDAGPITRHAIGVQFEAWQVSNPGTGTSAPAWNNAYTGTATIQHSAHLLTATVPGSAAAWDLIQQIAAAELATAGFDELGNFTYYPRSRWTSAPYTTSQRTVDAATSLTAIATSEATDQLRNRVRITATPARLNPSAWVWVLSGLQSVPASGTATVTAVLDAPAWNLSTSIRYASTSGTTGQSQYRANQAANGSGSAVSNLSFAVAIDGSTVTITVTNPNAFVVYLVSGSGFTDPPGTPSLALWGQPVTFGDAQQPDTTANYAATQTQSVADVQDATSIAQHGEQLLELSNNPWLQDVSSLTTLATDLLARLKDPLPILDGLTIVGDPRLQLGDRITVVDPTLGLNGDFFLTGITSTFDGTGYTQALTVRGIS